MSNGSSPDNTMTVNLTGVPDQTNLTLSLANGLTPALGVIALLYARRRRMERAGRAT